MVSQASSLEIRHGRTCENMSALRLACTPIQLLSFFLAPPILKAWLEMVDLAQEIKARGRKPAFGPMSAMRNKRILAQAVEDEDRATVEVFQVLGCFFCPSATSSAGWRSRQCICRGGGGHGTSISAVKETLGVWSSVHVARGFRRRSWPCFRRKGLGGGGHCFLF